jgi:methyl-accepting chemotaxis protein
MADWQHGDHAGDRADGQTGDREGDQSDLRPPVDETKPLQREAGPSHRRAGRAVTAPIRHRPAGLTVAAIVLGLLLLATAALATYLWRTTDEWRAEADRLEILATEFAAQRDLFADELDQAERDLNATEEQLREAQNRITSLADEKAQTADEREVARQVAGSVVSVANQLEVCVRGQSQLITALENVEDYNPASVSAFAREVSGACNEALDGSKEIKSQLGIE